MAHMAELRNELLVHRLVWINHHYLLRYATEATPRLLWFNFARLFGLAALVALKYPLVGLGICIGCLIVYLKPDPPGAVGEIRQI
jgi:hypothetical protein